MRGEPQPGRLHLFRGLLGLVEPRVEDRLVPDEGEFIVDEVLHHWVVYVPRMLETLLVIGLVILAVAAPPKVGVVIFVLALVLLARTVAKALASFVDRFVITNLRVFRSWGLVSQQLATMPIQRILDIAVLKPVLGRVLDYGHFVFESAAQDQGLRDIRFVPRPFDRDLTMQTVIQRSGLRKPMQGGLGDDDEEAPSEEPDVVPVVRARSDRRRVDPGPDGGTPPPVPLPRRAPGSDQEPTQR